MGLLPNRNVRLSVWIASMTLMALTGCAMPLLEETVDELASEELPEDSQLPPDETTSEPVDLEDAFDSLMEPPGEGPRNSTPRDPRRLPPDDGTRTLPPTRDDAEDPPVDDVEEPPPDDCLSPDDGCCLRAISFVRRLEQRGFRFTDEGRVGGLIRSSVAETPACFVDFVFADNMTCSLETGTCEPIDE